MQFSSLTIFAVLSMAIVATAFTCNNETRPVSGKAYPYPRCCELIGRGHGGVETGINCTTADLVDDSNTTAIYNCANATLSGHTKAACWSGGYIGTSEECFTVIL